MADISAPCPVPESLVVVLDPAAGIGTERDREMNITDSVEGEGLLESSMRLKPHEAQNYRKKALWVSWISIVVTLILAVAAFILRKSCDRNCIMARRDGIQMPVLANLFFVADPYKGDNENRVE
ncbi:transmembrane protein 163a [Tachysurus ichikawai]